MAFGTFDNLHEGHINFFKQAKKLAKKPFLIVSVARDKNVEKIKGKFPDLSQHQRTELVRRHNGVDKVVLAGLKNHHPHILSERPDIIALGYDQKAYIKNIKKDLKNKGLSVRVVRLKPYKANIYKNRLLKAKR